MFTFAAMLEGRYGAVAADATEGLQLAREAGLTNSACHHLATLAWVAAIRGQEAQCQSLAHEVVAGARRLAVWDCSERSPSGRSACWTSGSAGRRKRCAGWRASTRRGPGWVTRSSPCAPHPT